MNELWKDSRLITCVLNRSNISNNSTVSLSVHNISHDCSGSLTQNNVPSYIINNFTIIRKAINVLVTILPAALRKSAVALVATTVPAVSRYKFFRHKAIPISPVLLRNPTSAKMLPAALWTRPQLFHGLWRNSLPSQHKQPFQQWVRKEYFHIWLTVVKLTCLYLPDASKRRHSRKYFYFGRIACPSKIWYAPSSKSNPSYLCRQSNGFYTSGVTKYLMC